MHPMLPTPRRVCRWPAWAAGASPPAQQAQGSLGALASGGTPPPDRHPVKSTTLCAQARHGVRAALCRSSTKPDPVAHASTHQSRCSCDQSRSLRSAASSHAAYRSPQDPLSCGANGRREQRPPRNPQAGTPDAPDRQGPHERYGEDRSYLRRATGRARPVGGRSGESRRHRSRVAADSATPRAEKADSHTTLGGLHYPPAQVVVYHARLQGPVV
jgi:hypothetical protein